MGGVSEAFVPEQLLADAAWLSRLARSLASSDADADDLVQESWIAAWHKRPATDRSLRPWLVKVMRDLANMKRRGERRRVAREQTAQLPEATPADVLLEQMRLHRLIVELVLALPEPYRSTVIARFVEGRSAASIARSLGVPESTVRGRLHEAVARLRTGLDAKTGGRRSWAPLVIAFARRGVMVTKTSKSIALVVVLALALLAILIVPRLRGSPDALEPAAGEPQDRSLAWGATARPSRAQPVPAWFGVQGARSRRIAGRVTFEDKPVADAVVTLYSDLVWVGARAAEQRTTGVDGSFDFGPHPLSRYQVAAEASGRVPATSTVELADPALAPPPDRLELRLQGCRASIAGTIYDASGGSIAKARVRRDGIAGVVADEHGAYRLCVMRGRSDIEFAADGYGSVVLGLDVDGEQRQDIVLVPEASIGVRVVDDDDSPVPGAAVFAVPQEWTRDRPQKTGALTDARGRARLARLVPGPYQVVGFAQDLRAAPVSAIAEVVAGPEVIVRMSATARITGTVVANGKPVGDATIVAIGVPPSARSLPGFTAPDGTFALDRVALGEVTFSAHPYEVTSPARLRVDAARTYANVVIKVEALGSIRGRVTRNGKPVENVEVCCVRTPSQPPRQLTDAAGRYQFTGVPAGRYELGASADDVGAFAFGKKLELAHGEGAILDLELDQAAAISGTVVDETRRPVAGVFVRWMHETTGDVGRCLSDSQGRYRCAAMTGGGRYRAAVFPAEARQTPYQTADGRPHPVLELKDGSSRIDDVTLAIDYRRLTIGGRVVDDTGAPIPDAEVRAVGGDDDQRPQFQPWARLPRTFTAADGTFTIAELSPGTYALQARAPDGGEGTVTNIAAGTTSATIDVVRAGGIAGTLAGYAAPPAIHARLIDGTYRMIPATVDGTSAFRITGLRPGRYLIGAQTSAEGDAQVAEVRAGMTTQLAMVAKGHGVIDGRVLDFRTGAPIANARCQAVMAVEGEQVVMSWDLASAARSRIDGSVVIDPAPAGSLSVVCAMAAGWSSPSAATVLAPGGRASLQLFTVALTTENGGATGIGFDGRVIMPRIAGLAATSPARAAGLVIGDVVTAVNGVHVDGLNGAGVSVLIDSEPVGSVVLLTVARGDTVTFTVPPHSK